MIDISLAANATDRVAALVDGRVPVPGVNLTTLLLPVEEIFLRAFRAAEFDVTELSLSSYAVSVDRGDAAYVALPVFPSRAFRHNGIWIRTDGSVQSPRDLVGRRVGVPEYQMTAALWIRGMLDDDFGVAHDRVAYRTGGLYTAGRSEKIAIAPPGVDIAPLSSGTLSEALHSGEIDALYSPYPPAGAADGAVRRLWTDTREVEADYFRRTGIFPIMHVFAIRRDVVERHRWLPAVLTEAFTASKDRALAALAKGGSLAASLPFGFSEVEWTRELMGEDYWPYGVEANRVVLEAAVRYLHRQGLTSRELSIDELLPPLGTTGRAII